ncbi:sigma-54-dependent Fis family transcriptional regulator [Alkalihalobacillus pseudalcaliphilus]|uniref:sigma-54-dependent Fis family transcriptional regulator n=1 Tax=Alkalihalobacillus pseudalcaliphilus TaxID=79884 RepID=UPI00069F4E99|nr:sigma-54-dependent Fis family transcriptional regulator [Alkalihalobacillus pseudalcaliphilus]
MLHIHIIAPYQAMSPIIEECQTIFDQIQITYSVGDLQRGLEMAKQKEHEEIDLFISRGGTAKLLREHVTIPVIDIHLSGYDLTRSLTLASQMKEKTAVVGFANITTGASSIIDLLNLPLKVYTIDTSEEVAPLLLQLKEEGYQHILGDVITVQTSELLGLRGMLLQSGKESIIRAIEEALFLWQQLNKQQLIQHILNQLLLKTHRNIIIFNQENEIIYKKIEGEWKVPLSDQDWYLLHTSIDNTSDTFSRYFNNEQEQIRVTGYRFDEYKVYTIEKYALNLLLDNGIKLKTTLMKEPIATKSETVKHHFERMKALYENNKPIMLTGEKGTGKKFLATQVHVEMSHSGLLIELDANMYRPKNNHSLFISKPTSILIYDVEPNAENLLTVSELQQLCQENQVQLFITSEQPWSQEWVEDEKLHQIHLPKLSERMEDLHELVHYFLFNYHQKYGTTAMKISDDALIFLRSLIYVNHIDSLRDIIKQAVLNENDYILHEKTIQFVIKQENAHQGFPIHGTLKEMETAIIEQVLKEEDYNQTKAANRLGINRATLWRKLKG